MLIGSKWCAETFDLLYLNYIESVSIACENSKDIQCQNETFDDFSLKNENVDDFRSLCTYNFEEWKSFSNSPDLVLEHMGPYFKIVGIDNTILPDDPLFVSVEKIGYHMCDEWKAKIIDTSDNSLVWERDYFTTCIVVDPPKKQKFEYTVSSGIRPITISNVGNYQFQITIGDTYLKEDFMVRLNTSGASLDKTTHPIPESLSESITESRFEEIKEDIEKTEYDICNIRLKDNKIIIDLHKFFEGSEPETKIISKIPSTVDYEIVYHDGYSDYFINTLTAHSCDELVNIEKDNEN